MSCKPAGSRRRDGGVMAIIGMDIHRSFAQVAFLENGQIKREQRVELVHDRLVKFAKTLSVEDEVVIEATGNSAAVERILRPFVKRIVVANSRMVRAIAYARVKTDKIDAAILAKLHAGGFLPEVWVADDDTQRQRRQIAERMGVLEQMVGKHSRNSACESDPEVLGTSVRQGGQGMVEQASVARRGKSRRRSIGRRTG